MNKRNKRVTECQQKIIDQKRTIVETDIFSPSFHAFYILFSIICTFISLVSILAEMECISIFSKDDSISDK